MNSVLFQLSNYCCSLFMNPLLKYINDMKYIVKFVLIMLVIIASVSCNDRSNMEDATPVVEVDLFNSIEELPMSSFIDTLISVRLELSSPLFFGVTSEILFTDTNIYVVDEKQTKIFRFNSQGKFLNTIGKLGNGPGEFSFCQYVMAKFCQCYWQCLANTKAKSCHAIGSVLPIQRQILANSMAPQSKS